MTDLSSAILENLTLSDPFMIASSHWTATENSIKQLSSIKPSAITLKTTSQTKGAGSFVKTEGRDMRILEDVFGNKFARYTDGPTELELWDFIETYEKTKKVREILPNCVIGVSVLQNEKYSELADILDLEICDYIELNWKYTFRGISFDEFDSALEKVYNDLEDFLKVFVSLPKLIKFPREALPFLEIPEFKKIYEKIEEYNAGIIVANSRKIRVPPSRISGEEVYELNEGVVVGEYLFLETYDSLRSLFSLRQDQGGKPRLIASGGIVDIGGFIDTIAAGADCVQLCTALDLWGIEIVELFREQLQILCKNYGSFQNLKDSIRNSPEKWSSVIIDSRKFELDKYRIVKKICQDDKTKENLKLALKEECSFDNSFNETIDETDVKGKPLSFVITKGNASSFLLARRCIRHFGFLPVDFENVQEWITNLKSSDCKYDFAIIPELTYEYILLHKASILEDNFPEKIDIVSNSVVELVGVKNIQLNKIALIYHFGGTSSRAITAKLIKEMNPIKPKIETINVLKLTPLLRAWNQEHAILAKPPLSRMYGELCQDKIRCDWGQLWESRLPIILVASNRFISTSDGEKVSKIVGNYLKKECNAILEDLELSTKELIQDGFLEYCAILLGAKKVLDS